MIRFNVNDMTCGHCAATITKAVKAVDAAAQCEVDLAARQVRIVSEREAAEFQAAIDDAGYTPVPA